MENDLKWIKKHYGEKMMHMCREFFPKILETEGLLPKLLQDHFAKSKFLAQDIIQAYKEYDFKDYIYSLIDVEKQIKVNQTKSAVELMKDAGYILFPECKTEEDVQSFKKYWAKGEELCTFRGERLNSARVWFAIKEDIENIKREDFKNPTRQDKYGTSAISIQFAKNGNNTLSIKNRYNHSVNNPDNTFNSDLDNIILGLSSAFEHDYGIKYENKKQSGLELDNYIQASDGKFYHYNLELNNIYYCDNNIIIDNFEAKKLSPNVILADQFIFDTKSNAISCYKEIGEFDDFLDTFGEIERIYYANNTITIKVNSGEDIVIRLDKRNRIIAFTNENLTSCGNSFLQYSFSLAELNLPNLKQCGNDFLQYNINLKELTLPNLEQCGDSFLSCNTFLKKLNLPKLTQCGDGFLRFNNDLYELNLPNLEQCGYSFLASNAFLKKINLPKLSRCGNGFMRNNDYLERLNLPNLEICGKDFLQYNFLLSELNLPRLQLCGDNFLLKNTSLTVLNLPSLEQCGNYFLSENLCLKRLYVPKLKNYGKYFLKNNIHSTEFIYYTYGTNDNEL